MLELALLAALAYIPLLLTKPGMVASDTKQYLYLDPGMFLRQVASLWDPQFAGGMVTHQYIGYLLPQGPFYWLLSILHVPVWVAQRLWAGSLLFLAGSGVRYALRVLDLRGPGPAVAGVIYQLSPYAMQYIERISAILMPWSGLGWMLGFAILAVRRGGYKYPALFALVVALAGGTNATSLIFACLAPLLWLVYVLVTQDVPRRRVFAAGVRMAALSLAVSLWWAVALVVEGKYGISVLRYTETLPAIAQTSAASEVTRGLGYWYFYGTDRLGSGVSSSVEYTQNLGLVAVSFLVPALGFLGALMSRFRERAYFVMVAFVGLVLSVGVHPYGEPSLVGAVLKAAMHDTTPGLALRSTDRATPLVVLGLAALAGAGLSALWARRRLIAAPAAALGVVLAVVNAAPLMTGLAVDPHFDRQSHLPAYFASSAAYLDSKGSSTRVLIEPGENWADYTWGNTIDQIWSGILTRPSIQRQQLIDGSNQTADLLSAFDLTLQQGTYEPSTLAPIARLLSAGDVVLESDERYWHWGTPDPSATWLLFKRPPAGIGTPVAFGAPRSNVAPAAYGPLDEAALGVPPRAAPPPPLAVFPVHDARPIYRAEPAGAPLVLDGSGAGIVDAAGAGLLADNPTIIYSGSLSGSQALGAEALPTGAVLVLTDTNRKELRRWSSVAANIGETLPAQPGPPTSDPTAQALPIFASSSNSAETIATYSGAHSVAASSYGNPIEFTPEDRPAMAVDGSPSTAWLTSWLTAAGGQWLQVAFDHRVGATWLRLLQPYPEDRERWITQVTVTFDGGRPLTVQLGAASRQAQGQIVRFAQRHFSVLRVTIDHTRSAAGAVAAGTAVGLAEITIPGVTVHETLQLPTDLLSTLGTASLRHRLVIVLTRDRVGPYPPRTDPELFIARSFSLPTGRAFAIAGTARISATASNKQIDRTLGGSGVFDGESVTSDTRLPGDLNARAAMALDGNPATAWTSAFGADGQVRGQLTIRLRRPIRFDGMRMQVVADGRHSVPTWIRISTNEHSSELVGLPSIQDRTRPGSVVTVPLHFAAVTGSVIRISVVGVRSETSVDWYNGTPRVLPFSVAELGIPGAQLRAERAAAQIPVDCRDDLMTVDGLPVWLDVRGTVGTATNGGGLAVTGCGPDAGGLRLGPGSHVVVTSSGTTTGIELDRIVFDSASGGGASRLQPGGSPAPVAGTLGSSGSRALRVPAVRVAQSTATSARLLVTGATSPFWLVLGEGLNTGWNAAIVGGRSLGSPTLIDGYANGWYVVPHGSTAFTVDLVWEPQPEIDAALVVSGLAILGCVVIALEPIRRARRARVRSFSKPEPPVPTAVTPEKLASQVAVSGRGLAPGRALMVSGTSGLVAFVVIPGAWGQLVAVVIAALTYVAGRLGRPRLVLGAAAILAISATGAMTVVSQALNRFPPNSLWPAHFDAVSVVALSAFVALVADAAVETVTARGGGGQAEPGTLVAKGRGLLSRVVRVVERGSRGST